MKHATVLLLFVVCAVPIARAGCALSRSTDARARRCRVQRLNRRRSTTRLF